VVEGRVRVIADPADDVEIDLGDILVCPVTDPSWVSVMTVAGALVIDIGGMASHGAVIARELGVPCVIGTHSGTRDLRDGDTVRVDGSSGVVEVLHRAGSG
jgi:pyruvate,water dikinase